MYNELFLATLYFMIKTLALFDLDNTIIDTDSDFEWGNYLVENKLIDAENYLEEYDYFHQQYQLYQLDALEYLKFVQKTYKLLTTDKITENVNNFIIEVIKPKLKPQILELINWHKKKQHQVIVISATAEFLIGNICKQLLEINDYIGAHLEVTDGKYNTCLGADKVTRLQHWLTTNKLPSKLIAGAYFYSDSYNDLPLLQAVKNPIVVDADKLLTDFAINNNWQIINTKN